MAAAIALATASPATGGRIYNVAEEEAFSDLEWARTIAAAVGWKGELATRTQRGHGSYGPGGIHGRSRVGAELGIR